MLLPWNGDLEFVCEDKSFAFVAVVKPQQM